MPVSFSDNANNCFCASLSYAWEEALSSRVWKKYFPNDSFSVLYIIFFTCMVIIQKGNLDLFGIKIIFIEYYRIKHIILHTHIIAT